MVLNLVRHVAASTASILRGEEHARSITMTQILGKKTMESESALWTSLAAQLVRNLPAVWETWVLSLERERLPAPVSCLETPTDGGDLGAIPGKGKAPRSFLPGDSHGRRRPGCDPWRRERLRTPVFLPGDSHGRRSLAGYGS